MNSKNSTSKVANKRKLNIELDEKTVLIILLALIFLLFIGDYAFELGREYYRSLITK